MDRFVEDAPIVSKRKTTDGFLVADVRCARTGTQEYLGFELGKPTMDRVTVYRPEMVVFDRATMASFAGKPITDDHPPEAVVADNWRKYSRGTVGGEVVRDGEFVRVPMMIMDADLIAKVDAGKREISMGYVMALDWTPGRTPDGKPYDAIMTGMRTNHAAVVDKGRAGSDCRITDSATPDAWGATPITTTDTTSTTTEPPKMANKMMTVDSLGGLPIEVTDQAETVIRNLQKSLSDTTALVTAKDATIATNDAAHKTAIEAKDAEIKRLTGLIPTADDVTKMIADRVALIETAKTIDPTFTVDAKADVAEIRKTLVSKAFGEAAVKDASPDAISGMFFALAERTKTPANDGLRREFGGPATTSANDSQAKYEERIRNAHKMETK